MIIIDPISRQRIACMSHAGDIEYDRIGDSVISTEVLPVIGPWIDFTGSGGVQSNVANWQGLDNELWGTEPGLMGNKVTNKGATGETTSTTRRRQKRVYANISGGKVSFE